MMLRRRNNNTSRRKKSVLLQVVDNMLVTLITALLLLCTSSNRIAVSVSAQQRELERGGWVHSCSTRVLEDYISCVRYHPCQCSHCDPDPSDSYPVIVVDAPRSCQDVSRIFCPMIRCCSVCEDIFRVYHKCLGNILAETFLGINHGCPLFYCPLATFPYLDRPDGSCGGGGGDYDYDYDYNSVNKNENEPPPQDPTTSLGPSPPCVEQVAEYEMCVNTECDSCRGVRGWRTQLLTTLGNAEEIQSQSTSPWTCSQAKNDVFCPLDACCPACTSRLSVVGQCVQANNLLEDSQCLAEACPSSTEQQGGASRGAPNVASSESTSSSGGYSISSPSSLLPWFGIVAAATLLLFGL